MSDVGIAAPSKLSQDNSVNATSAVAECAYDKNGCRIDHDLGDTRRLLVPGEEPADHREDPDDSARAGHVKNFSRRTPGSRQTDRSGPDLSAALRVAAASTGALVLPSA